MKTGPETDSRHFFNFHICCYYGCTTCKWFTAKHDHNSPLEERVDTLSLSSIINLHFHESRQKLVEMAVPDN